MPGHRRSIRLPGHDYTQPGAWFVTLLTQGHVPLFGRIVDGEMCLNSYGQVARDCWLSIPDHYPRVRLDEWVVMPNHVHGILIIGDPPELRPLLPVRASHGSPLRSADLESHGTRSRGTDPESSSPQSSRPRGAPRGSLGAMIAQYKGASGRRINKLRELPGARVWHRDYHEHRIRHRAALERIRRYIRLNPARWERDRLHPDRPRSSM